MFFIQAQEEAAAQIQEMFSFIAEEEQTYAEKGMTLYHLFSNEQTFRVLSMRRVNDRSHSAVIY